MRLERLHIKNLRSCKDVIVPIDPYTCLVGPNGAGKSTILTALNIFFRESPQSGVDLTRLSEEDFHQKDTHDPVSITLTFTDLNAQAQEDFKDYYRAGKLIITAEAIFDPGTQRADVMQYGERLGMPEFAPFFAKAGDGTKVADLKAIYADLRTNTVTDLPAATTKDTMIQTLRDYEAAHQDQCKPLRSMDEFYGISKGKDRLEKYLQWVYVPAVKDASTEQVEQKNTALAKLLARTVRAKTNFAAQIETIEEKARKDYQTLLDANQTTLDAISASLQTRLAAWSHPDAVLRLKWWQDPDKAVSIQEPSAHIVAGEDTFEGQLCRLGHGLQRSFLLALLQELATIDDEHAPRLLLGVEEPELYQHPPQERHLFDVFQQLSQDNAQVIVSTHSPRFVTGATFEDVRLIRKDATTKQTTSNNVTYAQIAAAIAAATGETPVKPVGVRAKMQQALQANINEMLFTQRLILVEGLEDVAFITAYLHLSGRWDTFRRLGNHLVPVGGKDSLIQPLAIANLLKIPTLVVCDSDGHNYSIIDPATDTNGTKAGRRVAHVRDNNAIQKLSSITTPTPFPTTTLFHTRVIMWHSEIGKVTEEDIGAADWRRYKDQAEQTLGQPGGLEKNSIQIALRLALAYEDGKRPTHLEQLCARINNETAAPAAAATTAPAPTPEPIPQVAAAPHAPSAPPS